MWVFVCACSYVTNMSKEESRYTVSLVFITTFAATGKGLYTHYTYNNIYVGSIPKYYTALVT